MKVAVTSLVFICATAFFVTGCGSESEDNGFAVPDQPRKEIRSEIRGLFKDSMALHNYNQRFIQKCMNQAHFQYEPELSTDAKSFSSVLDETDVLSTDQVKENRGYPAEPATDNAPHDNAGYTKTPQSQREDWDRAFRGEPKEDSELAQEAADGEEDGQLRNTNGGCSNKADEEQYGSLEKADQADFISSQLILDAFNGALDDQEMQDLHSSWATCMKKAGFGKDSHGEEVTTPDVAQVWATTDPAKSYDIAMADATCQESLEYGTKRTFIEDRYLTGIADFYESQIHGALEIRREALDRSRKEFG